MQNKFKFLIIILVVVLIIPQISLAAWWNPVSWGLWGRIWGWFHKPAQVVCTQDAKQCPDGSYVSRQGPKCEFKECPVQIVGGDRDEHGCIGSAGYSWCEAKQKCLRQWEEKCEATEYHDVKYFFDTLEFFNNNLPRSGILQEVIVRGRLVQKEMKVLCIKAPCNPVNAFVLEDINDANYSLFIYETNLLLSKLTVGEVYTLKGKLQKDVDFGRKIVYISNFKPEAIIEN